MSLRPPSKRDDIICGYGEITGRKYYFVERSALENSTTTSPLSGVRLARSTSTRPLVVRDKRPPPTLSTEQQQQQRPRLVSHPSGSSGGNSSHSSGSTSAQCGGSARGATPTMVQGEQGKQMVKRAEDDDEEEEEEEEEGSMVLVKVPVRDVVPTRSLSNAGTGMVGLLPARGKFVRRVSRAVSADDLEKGGDCIGGGGERRCSSGTELTGLTMAMRLESQLLLLKRELCLYQAFDEASADIFKKSTHDEFFVNINQIVLDIVDAATPLGRWSYNRRDNGQAFQIQKHLGTAHLVVGIWNMFYDWLIGASDLIFRDQQEEGKVRKGTLERRRKECMDAAGRLLKLLGDVEVDEGVKGILDMQNRLRNQWKADGKVDPREAERMGWIWGVRS